MAVVARGKHYYLLQTEPPELEALYGRIEFLKP
jgi:hypothetical protein